jgi:import inner membrane translocase subunit TIM17
MREPHPAGIEPYPDYIIDAAGIGFVAGGILGFPYYFIKGLRNSPNGRRLAAGAQAVRLNVPPFVGVSAAYLTLVETLRYGMISALKKDDFWSHVLPSFAAGACLPAGRGPRAVATTAICCLCGSATVYGATFCLRRGIRFASTPPLEDSGLIPSPVVDSITTESVRDVDLRCTKHI